MIISPPFLLERNDGEADADYVARCMPDTSICVHDTNTPEGSFALSFKLGWHGGLHLQAPNNGQSYQNVRAVADGKIVFARKKKPTNTTPSPDEPLNYNPEGNDPAWTDDGCVVIRHETQIGANAQGQVVDVVYYSIYEHLSELRGPAIAAAKDGKEQSVWRKDEIGVAGQIYGREHQLHFEIVCDDTNLQKLINRQTGDLATGADGRSDVVFGEIYLCLPKDTPIYTTQPLDDNPEAMYRARRVPAWIGQDILFPSHSTTETYYVGIRYAAGDGAVNQRGHAYLTTYRESGEQVGEVLPEANAEYDLYLRATQISNSYDEGHRPAPSAVYELLRFGRIIDTTHETLTPADVPHWRYIRTPEGDGWVNLNAEGVRKFSDADFPHWKGWKLIDDDTDADSRCESAMLTCLIEDPNSADGQLTRDELLQRLGLPEVREKLKRILCKFPSELNQDRIDEHWGWLRNDPEFGLDTKGYDEFAAHVKALTIPWEEKTKLPDSVWHFQPREFITMWRKCGWLSENELAQCIPRTCLSGTTKWNQAFQRATTHWLGLNRYFRKFYADSRQRILHALAQIYIETGMLSLMNESGRGEDKSYEAFFGRGYLQLTWAGNYRDYGNYKALSNHEGAYSDSRITATSTHFVADGGERIRWSPRYDPGMVSEDNFHAGESSGFFWVNKHYRGRSNINRVADLSYDLTSVAFICWLINGGNSGYSNRIQFAKYMENVLYDGPWLTGVVNFHYPPLAPSGNPALCAHFPPVNVQYTLNGTVNYERQIP